MRNPRPGFKALLIGFHWPSQPWGDESLGGAGVSFGTPTEDPPEDLLEEMINNAAERIADTPVARDTLRTIFDAARRDARPGQLPPQWRRLMQPSMTKPDWAAVARQQRPKPTASLSTRNAITRRRGKTSQAWQA